MILFILSWSATINKSHLMLNNLRVVINNLQKRF